MISPRVRIPTAAELSRENKRLRRCIQAAAKCLNPNLGSEHERLAWWILWDALNGMEPRKELSEEGRK